MCTKKIFFLIWGMCDYYRIKTIAIRKVPHEEKRTRMNNSKCLALLLPYDFILPF